MATSAPDPMQTISVGHWRSVLGDEPHSLLTSVAFVIIREVCSADGELVPHVLLHTTDRRTYMKGVSSYFGLGRSCTRLTHDESLFVENCFKVLAGPNQIIVYLDYNLPDRRPKDFQVQDVD